MKKTGVLLLVIVFTLCASAQTVKKYSGQMSKPEWIAELFEVDDPYDINGYYSYYEDTDENRIIHGEFMISYNSVFLDGVDRYEIKGSFVHGKRDGKWEMKAKLLNGKYSSRYLFQFNYTNGVLNGPFQIFAPDDKDVEIFGQFANGIITGKVTIIKHYFWLENGYTQVSGEVNSKGNSHGIWTEKEVSEKAVPKDITRLYYDGNLVYRREKDLSSGKIEYTYSISDKIRIPADSVNILDTIIRGKKYVSVGGVICSIDTTPYESTYLYSIVTQNEMIRKIYPSFGNWNTVFDTNAIEEIRLEEQRIKAEEQRRRAELISEELRKKDEEEQRKREEEWRKQQEEEARLNAEIEKAWKNGSSYYCFCWGKFDAHSKFSKLYKEIGLDSIETRLDSIAHYEYENYTVEELFKNNPDYHYYIYNVFLSDLGNKKNKKLKKVFKTYEAYIQCKKGGAISLERELR